MGLVTRAVWALAASASRLQVGGRRLECPWNALAWSAASFSAGPHNRKTRVYTTTNTARLQYYRTYSVRVE